MDAIGRVIAVLLAVILIFLVPLRYLEINQEAILDRHVHNETEELAEKILSEGFIALDEYSNFLNTLESTNHLYDVELIHSKPRIGNVAINSLLPHKEVGYINTSVNKTSVSTTGLVTLTNNTSHIHTAACYDGDLHSHSAYGGSCYTYYDNRYWVNHTHTTSCYTRVDCGGTVSASRGPNGSYYSCYWSCSKCGRVEKISHTTKDSSCSSSHETFTCYYWDPVPVLICNLGSGYMAGSVGYTLTCGKTTDQYYNGNSVEAPTCNEVVISIAATKPSQTVMEGDSIITSATAVFLDGHSGNVNCTNNYNGLVGTQNVTLTYTGKVGNAKTTGTRTSTTNITTFPKRIVTNITVEPSSYTVLNGEEPSYMVTAHYDNGTKQIVTSGYTKSGFTKGAGTKTVSFSYTENGETVTTAITIIVNPNTKVCTNGHTYELDDYDTDLGCPVCETIITDITVAPQYISLRAGDTLNLSVTAKYQDGHTKVINSGWSSNFINNQIGNQLVTVTYEGNSAYVSVIVNATSITCPICGTVYDANSDGSNPGCPSCSTTVVQISASPQMQTVSLGGALALDVEAQYLDGHTEVVTDWSSNFNSYRVGLQDVSVYYKAISTKVSVVVESDTLTTCSICQTVYKSAEYPNGCPNCANTITGVEVELRNGEYQVKIGSELNIVVIVIFKDGHRELAHSGWSIYGYNSYELGEQILIVKYKEFKAILRIEVVDVLTKTTCENGHVYYLNNDGSDPNCPYCSELNNQPLQDVYFDCYYTDDIVNKLYLNGIYEFEQGDYFTITIVPKGNIFLEKLNAMYLVSSKSRIRYSYGGQINSGYI